MDSNNKVLIVDDESSVCHLLFEVVRKAGYQAYTANNGMEAIEQARLLQPAVIIMDIKMPVMDGMEAFEIIHQENPRIAVILMTAHGSMDTVVEAMRRGAFDYLMKPSNVNQVRIALERAFQNTRLKEELTSLRTQVQGKYHLDQIIGKSLVMQEVCKMVGRVAQTQATVLLTGESGSGKELIAKIIHNNSLCSQGPFIKINCSALPENLMESELFGYEKGAFTGAATRKPGRFELADKGSLFLDEIGELTPAIQVKLLRVLQERSFERVGGTETIKVDVRIIAATHRNLEEMVQQGKFREDLYYRLKVIPIHVPALRERPEDIPLFIDYYLRKFAHDTDREVPLITEQAMALLTQYHWPGNVRELANLLERAVIMSDGVIDVQDLPGIIPANNTQQFVVLEKGPLKEVLRNVEKQVIANALKANNYNRVKTAQTLDISRRALLYKIEEYGLDAERFAIVRLKENRHAE